jgi:hypothetical protein
MRTPPLTHNPPADVAVVPASFTLLSGDTPDARLPDRIPGDAAA